MTTQRRLQELKEMYEKGLITAAVYEQEQKAALAAGGARTTGEQSSASTSSLLDPKKNLHALGRLALIAIAGLVALWFVYTLSDREGKDAISQFASQTGIGTQVIPWPDRADTAARKLIERNRSAIAQAIQATTHPSGKEATLTDFRTSKLADRILVELVVQWRGGVLGGNYSTTVAWEIAEEGHVEARITNDSGLVSADDKAKAALNEYFRTKVYPTFYSDTHG